MTDNKFAIAFVGTVVFALGWILSMIGKLLRELDEEERFYAQEWSA